MFKLFTRDDNAISRNYYVAVLRTNFCVACLELAVQQLLKHCRKTKKTLNILAIFLSANFAGARCSQVAIYLREGNAIISVNCITIEHSENRMITYSENEVGPGLLQFRVQQRYTLQKFLTEVTDIYIWFVANAFECLEMLQRSGLLNVTVEHIRSDLNFNQPRLLHNFIHRMFYHEWKIARVAASYMYKVNL